MRARPFPATGTPREWPPRLHSDRLRAGRRLTLSPPDPMPAPFLLFCVALAALVPLTIVHAPAPPTRPLHVVRLKQHTRWFAWLTYALPYRARQLTGEDFGAHADRLKRGVPAEVSAARLAEDAFVPAWWHVGPLAPAAVFRRLSLAVLSAVLRDLAAPPPMSGGARG